LQKQIEQGKQELQRLGEENQNLKGEILKRDTDTSAKIYEVDKRSATEIQKVQMQNDSKQELATFQAIAEAIMQSQQQLAAKVTEMDAKEPDLEPIMSVVTELQQQLAAMQPVGIKQIRDETGKLIGCVRILADGTEQEISIQ